MTSTIKVTDDKKIADIFAAKDYSVTYQIFYPNASTNPDISGDTVTLYVVSDVTDFDNTIKIQKNADVSTSGSEGKAIFTLTDTDTNVTAGSYTCRLIWTVSTGEKYVIYSDKIAVLD